MSKINSKNHNKKNLEQHRAKENLSKLNPMVIPMLSVKISENSRNSFLNSSRDIILNNPHKLTEKWIFSLNKWVESLISAAKLDEPTLSTGFRHQLGPLVIDRISPTYDEYGTPVIICIDDAGWKWHFRTSKAQQFNVGDSIKLVAMVVAHKDGITFLSRPTKIELVNK